MMRRAMKRAIALGVMVLWASVVVAALTLVLPAMGVAAAPPPPELGAASNGGNYVVLSWNDLGMHCYNRDFNDLAVLPPYNNLWAQVIRVGNPPQVITTDSAGHLCLHRQHLLGGQVQLLDLRSRSCSGSACHRTSA